MYLLPKLSLLFGLGIIVITTLSLADDKNASDFVRGLSNGPFCEPRPLDDVNSVKCLMWGIVNNRVEAVLYTNTDNSDGINLIWNHTFLYSPIDHVQWHSIDDDKNLILESGSCEEGSTSSVNETLLTVSLTADVPGSPWVLYWCEFRKNVAEVRR
eukprot:PhM_4_TR3052/c0_g1_i2/m.97756